MVRTWESTWERFRILGVADPPASIDDVVMAAIPHSGAARMQAIGRRRRNHSVIDHRGLWLLAAPALLVVFVMQYMPLPGLIIAFKNYNYGLGIWGSDWSGLSNFGYLFAAGIAKRITINTVTWSVIFIALRHSSAILIALLLNEIGRRSVKLYQTVFFFPHFISWVIAAYLGAGILSADRGLLNQLIVAFGGEPQIWYSSPGAWRLILPIANTWKQFGYTAIIYYAALISMDPQMYEAAKVEGASRLQQALRISIPLLRPVMVILIMVNIGQIFRSDFGLFFQFTRDSAALYPVTDVIDTYVYRALIQLGDPGMAAAAGLYQSVVGLVLVLGSNKLVSRIDPDSRVF
jgi:putative aldouronate transport system permease protein